MVMNYHFNKAVNSYFMLSDDYLIKSDYFIYQNLAFKV